MCGRYYMSDDTIWEIERRIGVRISQLWRELRDGTRDICPSQYAIILRAEKDYLNAEKMRWGFPDFQGKGLLIQRQGGECPAEEDLPGQHAEQAVCDPGKRIL